MDQNQYARVDHMGRSLFSSKYRPEHPEQLITHMAAGNSLESFAMLIGIGANTPYKWAKIYPEFGQAMEEGKRLSIEWWQQHSPQHSTIADTDPAPAPEGLGMSPEIATLTSASTSPAENQILRSIGKRLATNKPGDQPLSQEELLHIKYLIESRLPVDLRGCTCGREEPFMILPGGKAIYIDRR